MGDRRRLLHLLLMVINGAHLGVHAIVVIVRPAAVRLRVVECAERTVRVRRTEIVRLRKLIDGHCCRRHFARLAQRRIRNVLGAEWGRHQSTDARILGGAS